MKTYDTSILVKKLYETNLSLLNSRTLMDLFGIKNRRSFFQILLRFQENNLIRKIEKDKYLIVHKNVSDFEIANFLYEPSYISLESALNYWGILSQFPFEITSVTLKKSIAKEADNKLFTYSQLSVNIFGMYQKKDCFLIATPEKAFYDQLYLASKGIRSVDIDEYDLSKLKKSEFLDICSSFKANKKINQLISGINWSC